MAQVAINWVANRPAVASVILGATQLLQLDETPGALDFSLPAELIARLDVVSSPQVHFPYIFFTNDIQAMLPGGATVGDKPVGYRPTAQVVGEAARVGK